MKTTESPRQYAYPAVFAQLREEGQWRVRFPDLEKREQVSANTLEEAVLKAHHFLRSHVSALERERRTAPRPTPCAEVATEDGEVLQMIVTSPDPGEIRKSGGDDIIAV
jgi:predicted RNase H-like HicB family nuclease